MLLPKGLWVVSVLAVPGDLLRLVYVTRDILARVHCFDVCAILSHVSFAIGPQDFLSHHCVVHSLPLSLCCLVSSGFAIRLWPKQKHLRKEQRANMMPSTPQPSLDVPAVTPPSAAGLILDATFSGTSFSAQPHHGDPYGIPHGDINITLPMIRD